MKLNVTTTNEMKSGDPIWKVEEASTSGQTLNCYPDLWNDYWKNWDDWFGTKTFRTLTFPLISTYPSMNVTELEDKYVVELEVPGYKGDKIEVSFENNELKLHGTKEQSNLNGTKLLTEGSYYTSFNKSYKFNKQVKIEEVEAELNDGILVVTLPKVESAKARKIKVK